MPAALAAGDFIVEYQPQVWLSTGALHGFEALVRWRPEGITISPELFVPLAEESGFVAELDLWVLRHALREAMSWNLPDDARTGISVNLSAQHFRDRAVIDHVRACLEETGFPPALLTLEITEGVLIDDWEQATAVLAAFRAIGLHVALDDFGTGYSSMSYLRRLAVSEVKIDRSFLLDLEGSAQTRMVLDGLVDIVAALGMRLVVEGIENEAQARILRGFGAQIGQGYLFGRSVPGSAARTLAMGAGSGPLRQAG
jgi:diguanylate cyclase